MIAVDIPLETFFKDRYERDIFLSAGKIRFKNPAPVYISGTWPVRKHATKSEVENDILTETKSPNHDDVRVARQTVTISRSKSSELSFRQRPDYKLSNPKKETPGREHVTSGRGVAKKIYLSTVLCFIDELLKQRVHLPKKMVIAHGAESLAVRPQPSEASRLMTEEHDGNAVYEPSESNEFQVLKQEGVAKI